MITQVSILTGPEGPAQRNACQSPLCYLGVSILTGPEGPVQRFLPGAIVLPYPFQSSPAPKDRCNLCLSILSSRVSCFNPHRPRRTGATLHTAHPRPTYNCFNPHRPRRTGATVRLDRADEPGVVSILTGPEGPVQRAYRHRRLRPVVFQSSPAPKDRCNRRV